MEGYGKEVDLWSCGVIMYIMCGAPSSPLFLILTLSRLCGFPPFYADNNALLFEKIMRGDFAFLSPYWDKVSKVRARMQRTNVSLTPCRTRRI